jgi:SecD/SecF fusion protein
MQNKGAIRFFAIALAVVCVFQLSFTLVTSRVESKAMAYAEEMAQKSFKEGMNRDSVLESYNRRYLDSVSSVGVYNILLKNYTYKECKEKELNLGLDLRGGMNVILEISTEDILRSLSNYNQDTLFNRALATASQMQRQGKGSDYVTNFYNEFRRIDQNAKLSTIFNTIDLKDRIKYESTNEEVLAVIRQETADAVERSFKILRTRIDKFGVTQPNIQKLDLTGRILIELPGVKDKERVRKLLQGTANLEFWETYENKDIAAKLIDADKRIAEIYGLNSPGSDEEKKSADDLKPAETDKSETASADKKASDEEGASLDLDAKSDTGSASALSDTTKKQSSPLFEILQPSLIRNNQGFFPAEGPVVGIAAIKDTGRVMSYMRDPRVRAIFPRDMRLLWTVKPFDKEEKFLQLVAIRVASRDGRAPLSGNVITDATGDFAQNSAKAEVSMSMNPEGAQIWKRLTAENIGKSIAIVLDDYVYSFPTVQSEISGGRSSITGNFDINEAKDLANILKAGKLPARARIVQEDVVGPSLGQEAIQAGLISFMIALLLVLAYMVFYYNRAGLVADLALFANLFFIMGVLTSLGAVLTLPGIAGIVLTIGLSVDANILIFERIREELLAGNTIKQAVKEGYKNALSSILDSNASTLILGIILYIFGHGPIQGFATTLIIGILTSLFSAIFITRIIFESMLEKNKDISFSTKTTEGAFRNLAINFVGKRKIYYIISSIIILTGIISITQKGFNFGVDFKGGRTYVVRFDREMTTTEVREVLTKAFGSGPEVKTFGKSNQLKITTAYGIDDASEDADKKVETKLSEGLSNINGINYEIMSSQKVGENISSDIKTSAIYAIFISCIMVFIYIFIRFKKWQFGLGAVIALAHDVLVILSIFTIFNGILPFSLEIDQHFIAAILTVMGYSMTDTVVVFDRIREYLTLHGKKDIYGAERRNVINSALNGTISRTFNTSITLFFVLLAIFVFGGEVIRGFSFALLCGVVVGTYSSICIATPIVIDFDPKRNEQ